MYAVHICTHIGYTTPYTLILTHWLTLTHPVKFKHTYNKQCVHIHTSFTPTHLHTSKLNDYYYYYKTI